MSDEHYTNHVVISECQEEDAPEVLYEVNFFGPAEDYGFDDITDFLTAEDAAAIAQDVAEDCNSTIVWECIKPGGLPGTEASELNLYRK